MTLKLSYVARAFGQRVPNLTFVAVCAMVAAVGCSDDSGTDAGTVAVAGAGAAGTVGAAGATTGVAGATTGVAGAATGAAGSTTTTTTGAAGAATGAAGATTTGAAGAAMGAAGATMGAAGAGATTGGGGGATLQMVYDTVYVTKCAVCHGMNPGSSNGMLGGIRGKQAFYDTLVNKPAVGGCAGKGNYITPGQPAMSLVSHKVSMDMPPCGARMPPGDVLQPEEIKLIDDWITAGAMNN